MENKSNGLELRKHAQQRDVWPEEGRKDQPFEKSFHHADLQRAPAEKVSRFQVKADLPEIAS